jgi:PRC-barrel domain
MAHYSTLRDYQFEDDVDDIRGAAVYGEGGTRLARIQDIVLDHDNGNIKYLVADMGHDRKVLVPLDRVFRTVTDEDSFHSDLTAHDLAHLPAFDDKMLHNHDEWKIFEKLHRSAMNDIRRRASQQYERGWEETPVEHMTDDVAHIVTPTEAEPPRARSKVTSIDEGHRRTDDYVPDLTPRRMAPVFTDTAPSSDKLEMVPHTKSSQGAGAEYISIGLEPRWQGYQERIRRNLDSIRADCYTCKTRDRRVA